MLTQSFLRTISEIAQLSLALPVVAMLFKFKKFNLLFWALGVLLLISTIIAFSGYILYANGTNNMPLLHIFTILEYACWSLFYYQLFRKKWQKRGILYLLVIFIICALVNSFYWQPFTTYNSFSRSIEGALLLCFAIIWFYEVFVDGKIPKLETHPVFWINAGVLVYFSGSFLLFISNNFLLELSYQEFFQAWALHGLFLIIHYVLITVGIWMKK